MRPWAGQNTYIHIDTTRLIIQIDDVEGQMLTHKGYEALGVLEHLHRHSQATYTDTDRLLTKTDYVEGRL